MHMRLHGIRLVLVFGCALGFCQTILAATSLGADSAYNYHLAEGSLSAEGPLVSYKVIGVAKREGTGEFIAQSIVNCEDRTRGDYYTRTKMPSGWVAGTQTQSPEMRHVFKGTRQAHELDVVCGMSSARRTAERAVLGATPYADRVRSAIQPHLVFTEAIEGNPAAELRIRSTPAGEVVEVTLTKSSGSESWDKAVQRAVWKAGRIPPDGDGTGPSLTYVTFRPKSLLQAAEDVLLPAAAWTPMYGDAEWSKVIDTARLARSAHESHESRAVRNYYEAWATAVGRKVVPFPSLSQPSSPSQRPIASILVGRTGDVVNVTLLRSSGIRQLDDLLLATVKETRSHLRPPNELLNGEDSIEIIAPFEFETVRRVGSKDAVTTLLVGVDQQAWEGFHSRFARFVGMALPDGTHDCQFTLTYEVANGRIVNWSVDPLSLSRIEKAVVDAAVVEVIEMLNVPMFTGPNRPARYTVQRRFTVR